MGLLYILLIYEVDYGSTPYTCQWPNVDSCILSPTTTTCFNTIITKHRLQHAPNVSRVTCHVSRLLQLLISHFGYHKTRQGSCKMQQIPTRYLRFWRQCCWILECSGMLGWTAWHWRRTTNYDPSKRRELFTQKHDNTSQKTWIANSYQAKCHVCVQGTSKGDNTFCGAHVTLSFLQCLDKT